MTHKARGENCSVPWFHPPLPRLFCTVPTIAQCVQASLQTKQQDIGITLYQSCWNSNLQPEYTSWVGQPCKLRGLTRHVCLSKTCQKQAPATPTHHLHNATFSRPGNLWAPPPPPSTVRSQFAQQLTPEVYTAENQRVHGVNT